MAEADVLIVGAGPTGLALACELAVRGVAIRVIDAAAGPADESRALGTSPRTLELLEVLGVADRLVSAGHAMRAMNSYSGGRRLARLETRLIDSAYDFVLVLPQSDTERVLIERLGELGVDIERETALVDLSADDDGVDVTLERPTGHTGCARHDWVVGCDGARSTVREKLGVPFEGERYEEAFNLLDVEVDWELAPGEAHVFLSGAGLFFAIPLPGKNRYRLIADEPTGSAAHERPDPSTDDFMRWIRERAGDRVASGVTLGAAEWNSRFRFSRRIVPHLRYGRVLFAGDSAHVHSPAGAQGMNSGIQDASNLGWRLASVVSGFSAGDVLDGYEKERLPVAETILARTHTLTRAVTVRNPVLHALRATVGTRVLGREAVQKRALGALANLSTSYAERGLMARLTGGGGLRSGDRAPDVALHGDDRLYRRLDHPWFTLLTFANRVSARETETARNALGELFGDRLRLIVVEASPDAGTSLAIMDPEGAVGERYGRNTAACLIRPDRYIAHISDRLDAVRLTAEMTHALRAHGLEVDHTATPQYAKAISGRPRVRT